MQAVYRDALLCGSVLQFHDIQDSLCLVDKGQRIFGADNTGGWLYHPIDNPSGHIPCEEFEIVKFLKDVKNIIHGKAEEGS